MIYRAGFKSSVCIVHDKRSDIHESLAWHLNDKHIKQMIITWIQHEFDFAWSIEQDSKPNIDAYDHFLVPRIPVLSTYFIIAKEQFISVITCHLLWFYILLKEAAVLSWVSLNEWFPGMNAPIRLYVLCMTNVRTFMRVLQDIWMINIKSRWS